MKGIHITSAAVIFVCMVLFPLLSMKTTKKPTESSPPLTSYNQIASDDKTVLRVYLTDEQKTVQMPINQYVMGVVAAEMPAEYHPEALKSQAVVARTYALYKQSIRKDEEYDVTDSHETDQAYLSETEAKERFGDSYNAYMDKISDAVNAISNDTVLYNGKPILASCHSISAGRTESAELLWGGSYPYLKPVESVGDVLSPDYLSEVTISTEDMKSALKKHDISVEGDAKSWITDIKRSESGYILTLNVGGNEIKGSTFRTALGLRSTNLDISFESDQFKLTVKGYGHGVGLSQYGAQFMALQGSGYKEILNWYYTDCTVEKYTP